MHSLNIYGALLLHSIVRIAILGAKLAFHTSCTFAQMKSVQLSFLALHNPAVCHLQYLSFTNDLYLGKNMPPTELRMSVKQSDWKPSSLLYTPWINRQRVRDEELRYNDQIGEMWKIKNSGIRVENSISCKTTDRSWFEFWSIILCLLWLVVLLLPCQCQVVVISPLTSYLADRLSR